MRRILAGWDRFWFQAPPSWDRLAALRVAFFALFGLDLWVLMAPRSYRVGAGGFFVAQLAPLQEVLPAPQPAWFLFAYLVGGLLALRVAVGIAGRLTLPALTVLYGGAYYYSQQDGYQHHHLLAMMLLLCCFVPWERARWQAASQATRSWPLKLLYVQVSIVYLFTAVTKVDTWWLNGWALEQQVSTAWVRDGLASAGAWVGMGELGPYAVIAHTVMIWQFFVCAAFLVPKLRPLACITGPLFHVLVEVIGLKIRWFSIYMVALYYLLLFPDPWFHAIASRAAVRLTRARDRLLAAVRWTFGHPSPPAWLPIAAGALAGAVAWSLPYPGAAAVGVAFAVVGLLGGRSWSGALTTLIATAVLLALTFPGGVAYNFYRLDGGDKRRRGDLAGAVHAYEKAVSVYPGRGQSREGQLAEVQAQLRARQKP